MRFHAKGKTVDDLIAFLEPYMADRRRQLVTNLLTRRDTDGGPLDADDLDDLLSVADEICDWRAEVRATVASWQREG